MAGRQNYDAVIDVDDEVRHCALLRDETNIAQDLGTTTLQDDNLEFHNSSTVGTMTYALR